MNDQWDGMNDYDGEVEGEQYEDESDKRPATHVTSLWVGDQARERYKTVCAHHSQTFIGNLKPVLRALLEHLIVAHVGSEQRSLQDDKLDLKVGHVEQEYKNDCIN